MLYLVLICAGFFVCGIISLVTSIVYLVSVRPRLAQLMKSGAGPLQPPYPSGYGYASQVAVPGSPGPGWWLASDGNWYPPPNPPQ